MFHSPPPKVPVLLHPRRVVRITTGETEPRKRVHVRYLQALVRDQLADRPGLGVAEAVRPHVRGVGHHLDARVPDPPDRADGVVERRLLERVGRKSKLRSFHGIPFRGAKATRPRVLISRATSARSASAAHRAFAACGLATSGSTYHA